VSPRAAAPRRAAPPALPFTLCREVASLLGALVTRRLVRSVFTALNRGDHHALLSFLRDDATWSWPGDLSVSGVARGRGEIARWLQTFRERVPTNRFELRSVAVDNPFDLAGTNAVVVEWANAPINRRGEGFYVRGVTTLQVVRGRIAAVRHYVYDYERLRALWDEPATVAS
jgi:ketosteroid isomerase-like protein